MSVQSSYKKAVFDLAEMLSDRGDSKDDINNKVNVDLDTLFGKHEEFTKQMVCLRRILRAQELGRED